MATDPTAFARKVKNRINAKIARNELNSRSKTRRVPYIGKWLSTSISKSLHKPSYRDVTVKDVLDFILTPLPGLSHVNSFDARVAQLCQNKRPSHCVRANGQTDADYFVRDVNAACAISLPIVLMALVQKEHLDIGGVANFMNGLQASVHRMRSTTSCECLGKEKCDISSKCFWLPEGVMIGGEKPQCIPKEGEGFEGVPPFFGQIQRTDVSQRPLAAHGRPDAEYGRVLNSERFRRRSKRLRNISPEYQSGEHML